MALSVGWFEVLNEAALPSFSVPFRYINGLAKAITHHGGRIYEMTRMTGYDVDGHGTLVTECGAKVRAREAVVLATNSPTNRNLGIHARQEAYRTYVVAFRIPKGSVPRANFWDTLDAYHYVRVAQEEGHDVLVVGGEDHVTGLKVSW